MKDKDKVISWMLKLDTYAREQKLPIRILDEIEDCKAHIEAEDLSWQELRQRIEEVLESVRQKGEQTEKVVQRRESGDLSVQKVQARIQKMAEECQGENQDSVTGIEERKNLNIRECYQKMNEISHTEAHLEQMLDENRFLDYFQKISYDYEKDTAKTVRELFEDIGGNYNHMVDHMRSMFQSIGNRADVSNEKFYREYESRKDGLEKSMEAEVQTADFGKNVIMAFAQKTKEGVGEIRKKQKPKKIILSISPLFLIFAVIIGKSIVEYQNADTAEKLQFVVEFFLNAAEQIVVCIFLILLIIVAYTAYLKFLGKWHRSQICSRCESYLKEELAGFQQENLLCKKTDETIAYLVKEYERQHLDLLNRIFQGTKYENRKADDALNYETLTREWDRLK